MSHLYIVSPSSAVRDKPALRRGLARLKALGHQVELDPGLRAHHQRFAGDDEARLAALERAAASGADAVLISRGGYGLTRVLDRLPYKAIARSIRQGTRWVGLSDFTALQLAVLAKTGAVTWAGPAVGEDFGAQVEADGSPDLIMEACFDDLLGGHGEGAGWRLPAADLKAQPVLADWMTPEATLWGGNLSVLCSLVGTPYLPEVRNGILFVEDVHEHPYRVERMLTQLLQAGILGRQKAIVLGSFSGYKLVPGYDRGFDMPAVVAWLRSQLKVPVLTGLPFGHVPTKVLLPVGQTVRLVVQGRDALMLWGHDHPQGEHPHEHDHPGHDHGHAHGHHHHEGD
jgi:muramoyltetrapeptide carboxypeptidase